MKAYVTSIGEPTVELCLWSLKRNGFQVHLLESRSTLAAKLDEIYRLAREDFIRVDADTIVNKNLTPNNVESSAESHEWWIQFMTYDWYKQDLTHGGVQFIKRDALPILRRNVKDAQDKNRPESYLYRLPEFHNPRRCNWHPMVVGLNNYKNDVERVRETKLQRNQDHLYDWELAGKVDQL